MKKTRLWVKGLLMTLLLIIAGAGSIPVFAAEGKASLEYWSEGSKAAESITEYVEAATDETSDSYIPAEDRLAVFDLDGTIIGELYPSYFEYMMFIHRALYDRNYEAPADMKAFAEALEEGLQTGKKPEGHEELHAKYAGQAYAGMTIEEMKEYVREFMESRADGFENLTRGDAFYKPMVSLVEYLTANDFECYIVSGSDRTLVRALIKDKLPIPENRVIGMSYTMVASGQEGEDGLKYRYTPEDQVILGGDLIIKTIKMNKVSEIALEIGKVPVLCFGNSDGDLSMAQYTVSNKQYKGKAYQVLCDDLTREHGNMDKADSMAKTCEEAGFETISMRDDFGTIYGDDVTITDYAYDEASFLGAEDGVFTEKEMPLHILRENAEPDQSRTITVRYYEDMPNVPYVGIKEWYDCIMQDSLDGPETMAVNREGDGAYTLVSAHGEASMDTKKDVLSTMDISSFTNQMCLTQKGLDHKEYTDGIPYVKVKEGGEWEKQETVLDFGAYHIDIHGGREDVFFPVSTLSDLFSDLHYHYSACNGETFYFNNDANTEYIQDVDPDYLKPIFAMLDKDLNRPEDITEYSFHELCFILDHYYGLPGRALLNDGLAQKGLVQALEDLGEIGEMTLENLQDPNYVRYMRGIVNLHYFLGDGGHTALMREDYLTWENGDIYEELAELKKEQEEAFKRVEEECADTSWDSYFARVKLRDDAYGGKNLVKEGDTMVFVLDNFMTFDTPGWKKYYEEGGPLPDPEKDDIVRFMEALEEADKDPEIKNLVVDCSNNLGGSLDEVAMLTSLITGRREISVPMDDTLTGEHMVETFQSDLNLDGVFDEKDEREPYDLNFAVLTSSSSFSCGNAFPSIMKDLGYMIFGEQSGGGACAVMIQVSGEGLPLRLSSAVGRMLNEAGEVTDQGVPVDVDLVPKRMDGREQYITVKDVDMGYGEEPTEIRTPDYRELYDIERLSEEMNAFYAK